MNKFCITDSGSASENHVFFGLKTSMNLQQVNYAIAYLQLIYRHCPCFSFTSKFSRLDAVVMMAKVFKAKALFDRELVQSEIDIYSNSIIFTEPLLIQGALMNNIARPGAFHAMLRHISQATKKALPFLREKHHEQYASAVKELPRIELVLAGQVVKPEWKWFSHEKTPCAGCDFAKKNTPDLIEGSMTYEISKGSSRRNNLASSA